MKQVPEAPEVELLVQLAKENKELYRDSLRRAVDALLILQNEDGHFCGELQGDSILQSIYDVVDFPNRSDRRRRRIYEIEYLHHETKMTMGIDEPGRQRPVPEFDDARRFPDQPLDVSS